MKAVQITQYGGGDGLLLNDVPVPTPSGDDVLINLDYSGVNFIDIYMREGHYRNSKTYGSTLPYTVGMEGAGTVVDVGDGVEDIKTGDRVAYCLSRGSYSEYAIVPAWKLAIIPQDIDMQIAVSLMLQGCTAHYLCNSLYPLQRDQWCLVHAGAGGVGQLLIQLAKLRGAKIITTVGNELKAQYALAAGADHVVRYQDTNFADAVMELTNGKGVDVVYDSVGKETITDSIRCVKRRGTCCNYGGSSGLVEQISPLALAEAGSIYFTRPHLAHYLTDNQEITSRTNELFNAVRNGQLTVNIDTVYPLEQAQHAHELLENRQTTGKLLLQIR